MIKKEQNTTNVASILQWLILVFLSVATTLLYLMKFFLSFSNLRALMKQIGEKARNKEGFT